MNNFDRIAVGLALIATASPAFASTAQAPAPIAGVGFGAFLLIGAGYKAVKARIKR